MKSPPYNGDSLTYTGWANACELYLRDLKMWTYVSSPPEDEEKKELFRLTLLTTLSSGLQVDYKEIDCGKKLWEALALSVVSTNPEDKAESIKDTLRSTKPKSLTGKDLEEYFIAFTDLARKLKCYDVVLSSRELSRLLADAIGGDL